VGRIPVPSASSRRIRDRLASGPGFKLSAILRRHLQGVGFLHDLLQSLRCRDNPNDSYNSKWKGPAESAFHAGFRHSERQAQARPRQGALVTHRLACGGTSAPCRAPRMRCGPRQRAGPGRYGSPGLFAKLSPRNSASRRARRTSPLPKVNGALHLVQTPHLELPGWVEMIPLIRLASTRRDGAGPWW
jgi:hypothetical protein